MLLLITESNAWEHESWSYLLDAEKQGAQVLNQLAVFCEAANREFREAREIAFFGLSRPVFAASNYSVRFYDDIEPWPQGRQRLIERPNRGQVIAFDGDGNYKPRYNDMRGRRISIRRLHNAVVAITRRKENRVYKDFESLLLKGEN